MFLCDSCLRARLTAVVDVVKLEEVPDGVLLHDGAWGDWDRTWLGRGSRWGRWGWGLERNTSVWRWAHVMSFTIAMRRSRADGAKHIE